MITAQHHPTPTEFRAYTRHRDFHRKIAERAASLKHAPASRPMPPAAVAALGPVPFIYPKEIWFQIVDEAPRSITSKMIKEAVCKHFGVKMTAMVTGRRSRDELRPRQIAMFLCKDMTSRSLPDIGRRFGGKDHTTVLWAVKQVQKFIARDPSFAAIVSAIRSDLEASIA